MDMMKYNAMLLVLCLLISVQQGRAAEQPAGATAPGRTEIDLSGSGWKLMLDEKASWEKDDLYIRHDPSGLFKRHDHDLDPDKSGTIPLSALPVNPPTGGWNMLSQAGALNVSVPGTVEEYLWNRDGTPQENKGDYVGVSWWWRDLSVPSELEGKTFLLDFESVNRRAEVFVDGELVAYDLIGNTPFRFDITPFVTPGRTQRLAVRVTDIGGFFGWADNPSIVWGARQSPDSWPSLPENPQGVIVNQSHGFGGISGRVKLTAVDPAYIDDLWIRNTPEMNKVILTPTVHNKRPHAINAEALVTIREAGREGQEIHRSTSEINLAAGFNTVAIPVVAPGAKLWDLDQPNRYLAEVSIKTADGSSDTVSKAFGFRWFDVDGLGENAVLRLNGKRIVPVSAISWGFWPVNGLYPTPDLARKQIAAAKRIGLNMLNFHRSVGQSIVLEEADRQGLLYHQEPGGAESYGPAFNGQKAGGDPGPFCWATTREKVVRMVKRDRSHPSMVIYNLANEAIHEVEMGDERIGMIQAAHKVDPTRIFTYASGAGNHPKKKAWMKPESQEVLWEGWRDYHHHITFESYMDIMYNGPESFFKKSGDPGEVMIWGEDGAIGTMPRYGLLRDYYTQPGQNRGWDGDDHIRSYNIVDAFLENTGLDTSFTVDSLSQATADRQYHYQGRVIENVRIDDRSDGYILCGWENDKMTSFPGLVDILRNPKTENLELFHYYTAPLYLGVKLRDTITHVGEDLVGDIWIVNEEEIEGEFQLRFALKDPSGKMIQEGRHPVEVSGGDRHGELLAEGIRFQSGAPEGYYRVDAELLRDGKIVATGSDRFLALDWKAIDLPQSGALLDPSGAAAQFLAGQKHLELPDYDERLGKLDYVVVGQQSFDAGKTEAVTAVGQGFTAHYFHGADVQRNMMAEVAMLPDAEEAEKTTLTGLAFERIDPVLDFNWSGKGPDPSVKADSFSVRWGGSIQIEAAGWYEFSLPTVDKTRVDLDERRILSGNRSTPQRKVIELEPGLHKLKVEYTYTKATPAVSVGLRGVDQDMLSKFDSILERVKNDGTTAILLSPGPWGGGYKGDDTFIRRLAERKIVKQYNGISQLNMGCYGGGYFAGESPLLAGLPQRCSLSWEYQLLANRPIVNFNAGLLDEPPLFDNNFSLMIPDIKTVVGAYSFKWGRPYPELGVALGVIPYGKGNIVVSSLQILPHLNSPAPAAQTVRRLFSNLIKSHSVSP